jgi:hypothetical protein
LRVLSQDETGPDAYLFGPSRLRPGGCGCYSDRSYGHAVRVSADACGLPKTWCAYSGRHARARLVREQAGDEAARAVLGHRTLSMTLHYGAGTDAATALATQKRLG